MLCQIDLPYGLATPADEAKTSMHADTCHRLRTSRSQGTISCMPYYSYWLYTMYIYAVSFCCCFFYSELERWLSDDWSNIKGQRTYLTSFQRCYIPLNRRYIESHSIHSEIDSPVTQLNLLQPRNTDR